MSQMTVPFKVLLEDTGEEITFILSHDDAEKSAKDGHEQQCVQSTPTLAGTGSVNAGCSTSLGDLINVKHELEEMDIGPTVLQHMDSHYIINQNMRADIEENTIIDDCNEAVPWIGVKESAEDMLTDNKTISCKYCSQKKTEEDKDETHLKSCHCQQKDLHQAMSSGVAGPSNQSQDETMKTTQKPFACDLCKKGHSTKWRLNFHKCSHSGVCHVCDAKFCSESHLARHLHIHTGEKPYQYNTCDPRFPNSIYTGEKHYQCDICDARFAQSGTLTKHMRVHTREKPYQCDTCYERFSEKGNLTRHMRIHTGTKSYQCDTCDERFAEKSYLKRHMRIHTGEKPYQCDMCNKRFAHKSTLTTHMRIHTGEKPNKCDTCDARFTQSGALSMHKKVHTGDGPYECDTCDASFSRISTLSKHKKIHIGQKRLKRRSVLNKKKEKRKM